jgi:hypothetical protein
VGGDVYETIDDLIENGLRFLEDFEFIDAVSYLIIDPEKKGYAYNVKQRVDWLKGRYAGGYVYVWYNDNKQGDA